CYEIANVGVDVQAVLTNTTAIGPYRGAGRPESVLLIERVIDEAARVLGMDPVDIRRKNFVKPAAFPYQNALGAVYDSGDYDAALTKALALSDYPALVRERDGARAVNKLVGIGLSTILVQRAGACFECGIIHYDDSFRETY